LPKIFLPKKFLKKYFQKKTFSSKIFFKKTHQKYFLKKKGGGEAPLAAHRA